MQSILKGLTIAIFGLSTLSLGVSLMALYITKSPQNDLNKQLAEYRSKNTQEATKIKELTDARGNAKESEQGIEYFEAELGKSTNANERRETKEYPEAALQLANQFGVDRSKLEKTEDDNLKARAATLAEKQSKLKDLVGKVKQARVERDKAKTDIEALEAQKKELLNRTAQAAIALEDARKRQDEVAKQLESARRATSGATR